MAPVNKASNLLANVSDENATLKFIIHKQTAFAFPEWTAVHSTKTSNSPIQTVFWRRSVTSVMMLLVGLVCLFLLSSLKAQIRYTITDVSFPGSSYSLAGGINNRGQVVGSYFNASSLLYRAFFYCGGKIRDIGTLPGFNQSGAEAINDQGQVVGYCDRTAHHTDFYRAFLYSHRQMAEIGTLGPLTGDYSFAMAINNCGEVVGESGHAFLYRGGKMQDLGTLGGGNYSTARAINDLGQVVGWSTDARQRDIPFLYSYGRIQTLETLPGVDHSFPTGINNHGQVVGWSILPNAYESAGSFLYSGGHVRPIINTLNSPTDFTIASGINNSGQVVGYFLRGRAGYNPPSYAFLYCGGQMYDLNTLVDVDAKPGLVLQRASAINDAGQIVGVMSDDKGQTRAFLLTPLKALAPAK